MKSHRFFINILSIFLLMLVLACGSKDNKEITTEMLNFPGDKGPKPVITFDSVDHHFNRVAIGDPVNWTFAFKNTGDAPLVLSQVSASCGCTTIMNWPRDPIGPGASGEIVVHLNTSNLSGIVKKAVSVLSNTLPAVNNLQLIGEVVGKEALTKGKAAVEMERTH